MRTTFFAQRRTEGDIDNLFLCLNTSRRVKLQKKLRTRKDAKKSTPQKDVMLGNMQKK